MARIDCADAVVGPFGLAFDQHHRALLGADEKVGRPGSDVEVDGHAAEDRRLRVRLQRDRGVQRLPKLTDVPEQQLSVRRDCRALRTRLALRPGDVIDRVTVRFFDRRGVDGIRALSRVPVLNHAVVAAANEKVGVLQVVLDADQR